MEKSCRKCAPKASPRTLFNFGKDNPNSKIYGKHIQMQIMLTCTLVL